MKKQSFPFLLEIGRAACDLGKYETAIVNFKEALKIQPEDADALYGLGLSQANSGKPAEARASLELSLKSAPDYWPSLVLLASMEIRERKDWAKAIKFLEKAEKSCPENPEIAGILAAARQNVAAS